MTDKALETIFFERNTERAPFFCLTKRAGSPVTFPFELEPIEEVIVPEHLLDRDMLLEIFERKSRGLLHDVSPVVWYCYHTTGGRNVVKSRGCG
jgi:hypothetical protein